MAVVLDKSIPLTLSEILGSAIASVIDAQAQSARASMEFIQEVGFLTPAPAHGEEKLRMLQFRYRKLDENQQPAEFSVEVPLLGIVDIPMVSVKTATFQFAYEITQSEPGEKETVNPLPGKGYLTRLAVPAKMQGRVARSPASSVQEKGNMQVKVELEKSAMPVGLEKILDILELAAAEKKSAAGDPA